MLSLNLNKIKYACFLLISKIDWSDYVRNIILFKCQKCAFFRDWSINQAEFEWWHGVSGLLYTRVAQENSASSHFLIHNIQCNMSCVECSIIQFKSHVVWLQIIEFRPNKVGIHASHWRWWPALKRRRQLQIHTKESLFQDLMHWTVLELLWNWCPHKFGLIAKNGVLVKVLWTDLVACGGA